MISGYNSNHPEIAEDTLIFDNATIIGDVTIGREVSVWANAVIRGDIAPISIGEKSNIQDNCVVHVTEDIPVTVGCRVTVGHGAILHSCTVEDNCLIGMGSIILDNAVIGEGSLVGAGSLVPPGKVFPPHSMIIGAPAKVVRQLGAEEREQILENGRRYREVAAQYRRERHI